MDALAMRLRGPLQSWGGPTAGDNRPTLHWPTQTGVLGLIAGALGIRSNDTEALVQLHEDFAVSVRVDAPGVLSVDYHTVAGVPARGGNRSDTKNLVTRRTYLQDACFTAVVVSQVKRPAVSVAQVEKALRQPHFAPYLGRRSCPPSEPIFLGVHDERDALALLLQVRLPEELGIRTPNFWDFYLNGILPGNVEGRLQVLKIRDRLLPGKSRLMGERWITHLRLPRSQQATSPHKPIEFTSTRSEPDWFEDTP